jgi:hypothetical protein
MNPKKTTSLQPKVCQCYRCANHLYDTFCIAFNRTIPPEILSGKFDHIQPHSLDKGLRFEAEQVDYGD